MENLNDSQQLFINSENLHKRIKALKIKQSDLARRLGVSESTISKWTNSPTNRSSEKRTITPEMLESLCLCLDCVPDYILRRSDSPYTTAEDESLPIIFPKYHKAINTLIEHIRKSDDWPHFDYTMIQCLNYYFSSMSEDNRETCRQMFKALCFQDKYKSWYWDGKHNSKTKADS